MPQYRLLRQAQRHIDEIREHTVRQWGLAQAKDYFDGMKMAFELLAANPSVGKNRDEDLKPGVLSFVYKSHIIYYRSTPQDIVIVGVMHHGMDHRRHFAKRFVDL
jgi:Plasmid stabilization system protein